MRKKGVLFVCYGNSCRSIMAEALTRHHFRDGVQVASAGIRPLGYITGDTIRVLDEVGVSLKGLYSKDLLDISFKRFDVIVSLTDVPIEGIIPKAFPGRVIYWYVKDPYGEGLSSFRQARDAIDAIVREKLPKWLGLNPGSS